MDHNLCQRLTLPVTQTPIFDSGATLSLANKMAPKPSTPLTSLLTNSLTLTSFITPTMFKNIARFNKIAGQPVRQFVRMNSTNYKINTDSFVYKYLQQGPKAVKFTPEHEWLAVHEDDTGFLGITTYASEALGDATFVELPEVGEKFSAGETLGSVESVKSASDIYCPVAGEVVAVNDNLEHNPQLINTDPMGNGWMVQMKLEDPSGEGLLTEAEYEAELEKN